MIKLSSMITPTHFIVDCQQFGGKFGPNSLKCGSPDMFIGVKFVWRIKKAEKPLNWRMQERGFTIFSSVNGTIYVSNDRISKYKHF